MKPVVQKVVVGGIVIHDRKALIIQRSDNDDSYPGLWELPSGKKEPLEKVEDASTREVNEETGINTVPLKVLNVFNFQVEKPEEIRDATQINFIMKPSGTPEIKLSDEHQSFAWVGPERLKEYNLSEETKHTLELAFKAGISTKNS